MIQNALGSESAGNSPGGRSQLSR